VKSFGTLVLAIVLSFSFAGCSKRNAVPVPPKNPPQTAGAARGFLSQDPKSWVNLVFRGDKDRLYFARLENFRCGLEQVRYAINGAEIKNWDLEPCYKDLPNPNSRLSKTAPRYIETAPGEILSVYVEVTYADGVTQAARLGQNQDKE
tara:strand:+ start:1318 stop:1761 length:444 start_codon:yes stop_codon:yes gene_type:complete